MSTKLRYVLCALWIVVVSITVAGRCSAQPGVFIPTNKPVIVGDTGLVGTYDTVARDYVSDPTPIITTAADTVFTWTGGKAYWHPKYVGVAHSKCSILVLNRYPVFAVLDTIYGTASSISDTMVRIRPNKWTVTLAPDSVNGGWHGFTDPKLYNTIADSTLFSDWTFSTDTNLHCILRFDSGSLHLPRFSWSLAHLLLSTTSGPTLRDSIYPGTLTIHVRNASQDSIYTQHIDLLLLKAPRNYHATVPLDTINFAGTGGQPLIRILKLYHDSDANGFTTALLPYPFNSKPRDVDDSTINITIGCQPLTSGVYRATLTINYQRVDFLQAIVKDSFQIVLNASIDNTHDPLEWTRTSSVGVTDSVEALAIDSEETIYVSSHNVFRSEDKGSTWMPLQTPFEDATSICAGSNHWVTMFNQGRIASTRDRGDHWINEEVPDPDNYALEPPRL